MLHTLLALERRIMNCLPNVVMFGEPPCPLAQRAHCQEPPDLDPVPWSPDSREPAG